MKQHKWHKEIPKGNYCYTIINKKDMHKDGYISIDVCPFWESKGNMPQANGYCNFLKKGDMDEDGTFLLFDMVKECGVNDD